MLTWKNLEKWSKGKKEVCTYIFNLGELLLFSHYLTVILILKSSLIFNVVKMPLRWQRKKSEKFQFEKADIRCVPTGCSFLSLLTPKICGMTHSPKHLKLLWKSIFR